MKLNGSNAIVTSDLGFSQFSIFWIHSNLDYLNSPLTGTILIGPLDMKVWLLWLHIIIIITDHRHTVFLHDISSICIQFWCDIPGKLVSQCCQIMGTSEKHSIYALLADVWGTVPWKYWRFVFIRKYDFLFCRKLSPPLAKWLVYWNHLVNLSVILSKIFVSKILLSNIWIALKICMYVFSNK